jgi:hypothetical protein
MAFDLIKHGTEAFVLKPFLAAYEKLKEINRAHNSVIDIAELRLEFQDCTVILHRISEDSIITQLEQILLTLGRHYPRLVLDNGVRPLVLHIPVFEVTETNAPCRFRVIGEIDETISSKSLEDYFGYWGLEYDYDCGVRVYDVANQLLIDQGFLTLEVYWAEMERRWKKEREQRIR